MQQMPHEQLIAYQLALEVARWVRATRWPAGEAALKDQAKRAADSVVLNIAEAVGSQGGNRRKHFNYARGSAMETSAVLDLLDFRDGAARQQQLRRVVAMLAKLE